MCCEIGAILSSIQVSTPVATGLHYTNMRTCNQHHILFTRNTVGDYVAEDTVCGQEIRGSVWYCCKAHAEQRVKPDRSIRYTTIAEDVIQND